MKFCKDCKHFRHRKWWGSDPPTCASPKVNKAPGRDVVTGKLQKVWPERASEARAWTHLCGSEAKHFEPKDGAQPPEQEKSPKTTFWHPV